MFVVLDGSLDRLSAEAERCLHFHHKFLIDSLWDVVIVVVVILGLVEAVPGVLLQAFDVDALAWISYENLREDVFGVCGEELWQRILSVHDFLVQVRSLLVLEGQVAAEHRVEDHSAGPNVRL